MKQKSLFKHAKAKSNLLYNAITPTLQPTNLNFIKHNIFVNFYTVHNQHNKIVFFKNINPEHKTMLRNKINFKLGNN